jgi:hypothetical protein
MERTEAQKRARVGIGQRIGTHRADHFRLWRVREYGVRA